MSPIDTLLAEAEIRGVHLRYCRGVDRCDWDLVRSCYHPDATDNHGAFTGNVDAFMAWVAIALQKYEVTTHFTGNQLVEVNGDEAWAEHYARVYHRIGATETSPAQDLIVNVRYVDAMARRDGHWRIARRVVVIDSGRCDSVLSAWPPGEHTLSKRDRSDASYARR